MNVRIEVQTESHIEFKAAMVSGLINASIGSLKPDEETLHTIQPFPTQWICKLKDERGDERGLAAPTTTGVVVVAVFNAGSFYDDFITRS